MKNDGFTLIELLGVIIVLGVLVTIVSITITKVLKDSETKLTEVQIEELKDAAKNYYINEGMEGIDFEQDSFSHCVNVNYLIKNGYIDENEISNFKTGEDMLGSIKIHYENKKYKYTYTEDSCKVCSLVDDTGETGISPGDKYQCKIKDNMEKDFKDGYYFYILGENNDGTVNLIMDQNIYNDGTPAGVNGVTESTNATKYSYVRWNSNATTTVGPITAMTFLYNATKDWSNIPALSYTYFDKESQGTTDENASYTSFISKNGILTITPLSGTPTLVGTIEAPLRARMPIYLNDITKTEVTGRTETNAYLYDNLGDTFHAYWTLSSFDSSQAFRLNQNGWVRGLSTKVDSASGVRPVITLPKNRFENSNW